MNGFMLFCATAGVFAQNIFMKGYTRGKKTDIFTAVYYNLLLSAGAFTVYAAVQAVKGAVFAVHAPTFVYAAVFSLCFTASIVFSTLALAHGPMSVSVLLIEYSLVIPTLFGVIFCNERPGACAVFGLAFLVVSLFLTTYGANGEKGKNNYLYIFLAFIGNGTCSVIQKLHQFNYPGLYRTELLECSALGVFLLSAVLLSAFTLFGKKTAVSFGGTVRYAFPSGLCNGMVNYCVLILVGTMDSSVIFPVITAGGIVLTFAVSQIFYREKLLFGQYIGYVLGILSVIMLNL